MNRIQDSPSMFDNVWLGVVWIAVLYVALVLLTKPLSWGDTIVYAPEIVKFSQGTVPLSQVWEFGHLFWRPIGYLVWRMGGSYWSRQSGGNQVLEIYSALRLLNVFLGFVAALASFGIAWRISRRVLTAALVSSAFIGWNAFLNYFQSGTAYVPGLALQLTGLYLLLGGPKGEHSNGRAWLAGAALALSVCLWFPYVFGLPGVFLLSYLWDRHDPKWRSAESRTRLHWLANAIAVCAMLGVASYASCVYLAKIKSRSELKTWVVGSAHGYQPGQRYFRLATGLPRSLVEVGQTGLMLKRFVLRDQYAPVGLRDLLQLVLLKLVLFYAAFASLIWIICRDRAARPIALSFFVGWGLIIFFAVVLFEPSQSERWLPAFAVLVPAVAYTYRKDKVLSASAVLLAVFLSGIWLINVKAYITPAEPGAENPAVARLLVLKPVMNPINMVTLLSFRDEINIFAARFPFHPLNRPGSVKYHTLTESGSADSAQWPQRFAVRGLEIWRANGDIWISKRMVADRPKPEWGWVEGDDPHLKWQDIAAFFHQLSFDGDLGGPDGFLRIAHVQGNERHLNEATQISGVIH